MIVRKNNLIKIILVLSFVIINVNLWAYRGSESSFCSAYMRENIYINYTDNLNNDNIKRNIVEVNTKSNIRDCIYDYAEHNSELIVFCKKHGSGSNKSMLDNLSSDSYYKNRFNHTAGICAFSLFIIGLALAIIRSTLKLK